MKYNLRDGVDAIIYLLHLNYTHLDKPGSTDFCWAFNIIRPEVKEHADLNISWIMDTHTPAQVLFKMETSHWWTAVWAKSLRHSLKALLFSPRVLSSKKMLLLLLHAWLFESLHVMNNTQHCVSWIIACSSSAVVFGWCCVNIAACEGAGLTASRQSSLIKSC